LVLLRSDKNFLGMKFETRIIRVSLLPEKKFEFQLYRKFEFAWNYLDPQFESHMKISLILLHRPAVKCFTSFWL